MAAVNFVQRRGISIKALQKLVYNLSGFNQYGLMRDDIRDEDDDCREALKRLPAHLYDARVFRLLTATQVSLQKNKLPKKQWMTLEKDVLYLTPYIDEVIKEREEKDAWNKTH